MVTPDVTFLLAKTVTSGVTYRIMAHPLTRFRQDSKLSRAALAKQVRTSRQTIHRIEKGDQTPSLDLVRRLVEAAGGKLRADDFFPQEAAE